MTLKPNDPDGARIVIAIYRPHEGQDAALRALVAQHVPALRRLDLITERATILARSSGGAYLEIFEWVSDEAAEAAHDHPDIARIWEAMAQIADFQPLSALPEAAGAFTHFTPVSA